MRELLFVPFLLALAAAASDPGQSTDQKLGAISGAAVNSVTGQPMAKINIILRPLAIPPGQSAASAMTAILTDAEGHFSFGNLTPGRYALNASRSDGMSFNNYGAVVAGETGTVVALGPAEHKRLDYRVIPRGTIAGTVVDREGEPVRRADLLITALGLYGEDRFTFGHGYQTNDRGEFRAYDLEPGRYRFLAVPPPRARVCCTAEAAAESKAPPAALLPTYYPSAPDAQSASDIDLPAGQEVSGIRIALREGPVYRVQGKLAGTSPDAPVSGVTMMLYSRDYPYDAAAEVITVLSRRIGNPHSVTQDGKFDLADVEPGVYDLTAMPSEHGGAPLGSTEVVVTDHDIEGVVLALNALAKLSLAVTVEGKEGADLSGGLMLWPLDSRLYKYASGPLDASGHGQVANVVPGQYRIDLRTPRLKGAYIKSARLRSSAGSKGVLETGLDLTDPDPVGALDIVLAADGGAIAGSVRKGDAPAPGRQLYLVPDIANSERSPNGKVTTSDDDGRFAFAGVAPGDYRLYAWDEITAGPGLQFDPAFRARYRDAGTKVSVQANQSTEVNTKVVEPR